ncbi:MAG TPA: ABC transporter ATP-binding protein [Gemmatimonadota bacterium]|nr:ABC transporter ATP-binding protein [Gemmatimonadota bacterium]
MLRGIDLTVEPGTSLVLTGANGAGKTTLLRIIATLLKPSSGEGTVLGLSLADDGESIRAATGYVSARGFAYDDLTAAENLRFAARLVDRPVPDERIAEILVGVGLGDATDQTVRTFSTGMRRRLALAVLRLRPLRLALLDEPYAGLDADGVALVDRLVGELVAAGTTVILASHQSGEATRRATRALRIEQGRLVDAATPDGRAG